MKKIVLPVSIVLAFILAFSFPANIKSASFKFFDLYINQSTAYIDGVPYELDQPPIIKNGKSDGTDAIYRRGDRCPKLSL